MGSDTFVPLDLSTTFDIDHIILVPRLRRIGLSDDVYTWFTSYLTRLLA